MKIFIEFCVLFSIVIYICVQNISCEEYSSDSELIPDKTYPEITNNDRNQMSDNYWAYPGYWQRRRWRRKRCVGWGGYGLYGGYGRNRGYGGYGGYGSGFNGGGYWNQWRSNIRVVSNMNSHNTRRIVTPTPVKTTTVAATHPLTQLSTHPSFNTKVRTRFPIITTSATTTRVPTTAIIYKTSDSKSQNPYTERPLDLNKVQCGSPQLIAQTKDVVGKRSSAFGAWPWQVSVRRTSFFGSSSTHKCGGALLNNQWVITAAHCVNDLLLKNIRIRVGEHVFSSTLEPYPHIERAVKKKVVHKLYSFRTYENDLALVLLDKPIDFQPHIAPICLPPENIELLGEMATVTGWGRLSPDMGGGLPTVLQEVKVPIISNVKCENMFQAAGYRESIPEVFMCAGYDDGGRGSCEGDSGGPLQVQGADGNWVLAGITSWVIGCGQPSQPRVYTRVSMFRQWILKYINP